jgi:hypothetical protein
VCCYQLMAESWDHSRSDTHMLRNRSLTTHGVACYGCTFAFTRNKVCERLLTTEHVVSQPPACKMARGWATHLRLS